MYKKEGVARTTFWRLKAGFVPFRVFSLKWFTAGTKFERTSSVPPFLFGSSPGLNSTWTFYLESLGSARDYRT